MSDDKGSRRGALKVLALACGGAVAGAIGVPAVRLASSSVSKDASGKWIRTIKLAALTEGVPKKVEIIADRRDGWTVEKEAVLGAVWLIRRGETVECLSVVCPHLGCSIDVEGKGGGFSCPCHDSSFAPDGKKLTGPSPRDLDRLQTRVEDGHVAVDFRKYRYGTKDRVEIG
jgi:cytochrome b6-f complex iron-sulfur subunit/menaquinol-cytochrome c reductase iron-sulfur subunit